MSSKDVADLLQAKLNNLGLYTFKVTDLLQQWYNYGIEDADGQAYAPCVVTAYPMPIITEFQTTRFMDYNVNLKGLLKDRVTIENIINNLTDDTWKFTNLVITQSATAESGYSKTQEFYASFRISIAVPTVIIGRDVNVKIDDVEVDIVSFNGTYDKALIANRGFNYVLNKSDINTGEEVVITFPLTANTKIQEIYGSIISNEYNRKFTFSFDFVAVTKTVDLVLRRGVVRFNNNDNAVLFDAVFTKALPRTTIVINAKPVTVIGFTPQTAVEPSPRTDGMVVKLSGVSVTTTFSFQLENDGSDIARELINEIYNFTNKKFNVIASGVTKDCILLSGSIPTSENPNAILNITLGVADDE